MKNHRRVIARAFVPALLSVGLLAPTEALAAPEVPPTMADAAPTWVQPAVPTIEDFLIQTGLPPLSEEAEKAAEEERRAADERRKAAQKKKAAAKKKRERARERAQRKMLAKKARQAKKRQARKRASLRIRALRIASAQAGDPYRYGAAGPNAFDCSGLTSFSFARAGKSIPRTSKAQRAATRHISAKDRQRGDLVFFHGSGGVYHVGIYAGDNAIWHAPYMGRTVSKERIWSSSVSYGRVG